MPSKIYCRNGYVVASELPSGGAIDPSSGFTLFGRDRADRVTTSSTCHEMRIDAVGKEIRDLSPGDHVLVYIGGDDGDVSANGVSAFVKVDAEERAVVHDRYIWAVVRDGVVYPRGRIALTKRNDAAFRRHTLGAGSALFLPEAQNAHGMRATGDSSDQVLASVTALYETVSRIGASVKDLAPGETVCFSPSFSSTRLRVGVGDKTQYYHLVDSEECFFVVA